MNLLNVGLNSALGLTVIANLVLGAWTVNLQRNSASNARPVDEFTNAFVEHRGARLQVGAIHSRSADFIRIEDNRTNGWLRQAQITCPPSALPPLASNAGYDITEGPGMPSEETLQRASKAFDDCPYERVVEIGALAKAFVAEILARGNYRLITRWSMNEHDRSYYSYFLVRQPDGSERYLHELLLERGLAYPAVSSFPGPRGEGLEQFRDSTRAAFEIARRDGLGGFKHTLDDPAFKPSRYAGRDISAEFLRTRLSVETEQRSRGSGGGSRTSAPRPRTEAAAPPNPGEATVPGPASGDPAADEAAANDAELRAAEEELRRAEANLREASGDPVEAEPAR